MGKHAILSASSSKRWLNCTPSARLEEQFSEEESVYAAEGTAAHALAEHKLKKYMKKRSRKPRSEFDSDELDEYVGEYVDYAIQQIEKGKINSSDAIVLIEQKLDFSRYVPEGFGTGDLIIVADKELQIIDLKYGKGLAVDAEKNPQMMLYALGALELFDCLYEIDKVSMTIHQPRLQSVSIWEIGVDELKNWAEKVLIPTSEVAYNGEGKFISGEWCKFCRARKICRVRSEEFLKLAQLEFQKPPLLKDEEVESILSLADQLKKWVEDIYSYAMEEAIVNHKMWTGFKLVEGRSNRKYLNEDNVIEAAKAAGYQDIFKKSLIGISEMEKLMGKKKFNDILGNLICKPKGKISLVPQCDKREPVNLATAKEDFAE